MSVQPRLPELHEKGDMRTCNTRALLLSFINQSFVILSVPAVILSVPTVILSVPTVILSEAKDLALGCKEILRSPSATSE